MARTICWIAATTALAAGLAGCGLGGGDDQAEPVEVTGEIEGVVTLQTWALKPNFTDYVEEVIEGFEAEYPDVDVRWLDQPGEGYSEKVLSQAASGDLPDVVNLPPDFALPLAEQGMLIDVDSVDEALREEYVDGGVAAYEFAGMDGVFGYPWYLNTDVNYWNAELLEEYGLDGDSPPTSFEELVDQARIMAEESGGSAHLMSRKLELGDFVNAGIPVLSEDGSEFVFNTPEAAALLDEYRDAFDEGLLPRDVLTDAYLGNSQLFVEEKVAWSTGGGNFINGIRESNPSLAEKVVPSPAFGTPPLYVQGLGVARDSDNLAAAVELARWVTNAENQAEFARIVPGIFPSTTASAEDPFFTDSTGTNDDDAKVIAFESLAEAQVLQPYEVDDAMSDIINQQISLAISGEVTSQEALDTAVERCNNLLGTS
ncbi:ABC transporter substrate-binding protein [Phytoactinopolyspora mesophila]|uniref:Extracellular solute-binding protein n=1 Tax=Phytoactinopolyspora mesophila TaxID=2650750 RepID=A0A7K3M6H7_9ACTN|nr:sugar ABC transporter substrate-binding protein [Phytoactinopolyspora mesophila]NDL58923.1 extracellular solute-binding protein [Phytoactinopolyspora mesophila]